MSVAPDPQMVYNILIAALCGCLALLIAVLGWIGNRVHNQLDNLAKEMQTGLANLNSTMTSIERDLRGQLAKLDRRVTRLEDTIPPNLQIFAKELQEFVRRGGEIDEPR